MGASGETADDRIARDAGNLAHLGRPYRLVTSDRGLRARAGDAASTSSAAGRSPERCAPWRSSAGRVLQARLAPPPFGEADLARADLPVQLVLDPVHLLGVRPRLRPEVPRVGRVAAELERDQVVLLVLGGLPPTPYSVICLTFRSLV